MGPSVRQFGLVIIGGGPAGMAPLLAAHRAGLLSSLLSDSVAVVERSPSMGSGAIGSYSINSDSDGRTFVDCLRSPDCTPLSRLADHPLTRILSEADEGAVALRDVGGFLDMVGDTLQKMIRADRSCEVLTGHDALSIQRSDGNWRVTVADGSGSVRTLVTRNVVLATGATQPLDRLSAEMVGGCNLLSRYGDKLVQSGDVFNVNGLARMSKRLAGQGTPRVAVIGGSTSAVAVAHALLHRMPSINFRADGVTILHRRDLHIYYPDVATAMAEGYTAFTDDDLCPVSGKVFRFAGFRLDSRELVMQIRGIGGRPAEPRVRLHRLQAQTDDAALQILDEAHVVVAALGYRPRAITVLDDKGDLTPLLSHAGPQSPLVDARCRVLDAAGLPLPGLLGIGLAAGFVPRGSLGGEPSFRGQANGLWLWQNDVGALIVETVRAPIPASIFKAKLCDEPDEIWPLPGFPDPSILQLAAMAPASIEGLS